MIFAGREFQYGGTTWAIKTYHYTQDVYEAKSQERRGSDVFDAFFVEGEVSCPLEVALLLGR